VGIDPNFKLTELRQHMLDITRMRAMSRTGRLHYYRAIVVLGNGRGVYGYTTSRDQGAKPLFIFFTRVLKNKSNKVILGEIGFICLNLFIYYVIYFLLGLFFNGCALRTKSEQYRLCQNRSSTKTVMGETKMAVLPDVFI